MGVDLREDISIGIRFCHAKPNTTDVASDPADSKLDHTQGRRDDVVGL